jgi:hypothetical protein
MTTKCIGIAAWLFASLLGLQAQGFEISPFYGYRFGGSVATSSGQESDLEGGRSYGLSLNYVQRDSDLKLALLWSRQESGLDLEGAGGLNHVDMAVDEFLLGGLYEYGQGRLHETVTVLVGATVFSPEGGDLEARLSFSVGVGVKYYLWKNLALQADLRGSCTVVESEGAFISYGGYTVAYFSGSAMWQGEVSGGITWSF